MEVIMFTKLYEHVCDENTDFIASYSATTIYDANVKKDENDDGVLVRNQLSTIRVIEKAPNGFQITLDKKDVEKIIELYNKHTEEYRIPSDEYYA
jgi:hypothetical protein